MSAPSTDEIYSRLKWFLQQNKSIATDSILIADRRFRSEADMLGCLNARKLDHFAPLLGFIGTGCDTLRQ